MSDDIGRVREEQVPPENNWHLSAVYEMEHREIERWLRSRAREALSGRAPTLESALAAAQTHAMTIDALFAREDPNRDPLLLEKARLGLLKREAPSRMAKKLFLWLTILAASLEVAIFLAMYFIEDSNLFVVAYGVVLAAGGWLMGYGLGNAIGFSDEEGKLVRGSQLHAGLILGGIVIVGGVAFIRSSGGGEGRGLVVVFTMLIALCVALFEALETWMSNRYHDRSAKMFLCQQWYATERHLDNARDGLCEKIFETEVRRLRSEEAKALRPAKVSEEGEYESKSK